MKFWLDQMLPGKLCAPIREWSGCEAWHVGTAYSDDLDIFEAARAANAVVMTKDQDFVSLVEQLGSPPQVVDYCGARPIDLVLRILNHSGHRIRWIAATRSTGLRPLNPEHSGRPFRQVPVPDGPELDRQLPAIELHPREELFEDAPHGELLTLVQLEKVACRLRLGCHTYTKYY